MLHTGNGSPHGADTSLSTAALSQATSTTKALDPAATMKIPPLHEMLNASQSDRSDAAVVGPSIKMTDMVVAGGAFVGGLALGLSLYFGL